MFSALQLFSRREIAIKALRGTAFFMFFALQYFFPQRNVAVHSNDLVLWWIKKKG